MSQTIRHALPLDSNLISYLTAMTSSWARKKIPIHISDNGLAYWNGRNIAIPDFRYSAYNFAIDYPLEQQFSFYSALTFHESMHAKFGSHTAEKRKLLNHPIIPPNLKNLSLFILNVIEDGRIERLGLIKREKSVIHHQLYRFNFLLSESNWINFRSIEFINDFDKFFNHLINQLFDLTLLGKDFLKNYFNNIEQHVLRLMIPILSDVFRSYDPNESIEATIKFFEIFHELSTENNTDLQDIHVPSYESHCGHQPNNGILNEESKFEFDPNSINFDDLREFLDNPFSDLSDEEETCKDEANENYSTDVDSSKRSKLKYRNRKKSKKQGKSRKSGDKIGSSQDVQNSSDGKRKKHRVRIIPKNSFSKENMAYDTFVKHSLKNYSQDISNNEESEYCEYIDTFGNDMTVDDENTIFNNTYKDIETLADEFYDEHFQETYDKLETIAQRTANYFLQLAGINVKKKDGVGNQKIVLSSQKDGNLKLNGNTLSQLLAGNKYIYNKEMPAKINISLDLVILVDLTGSMEAQVYCDERSGQRIEFVNEATVILAETFHILKDIYNLPLNYSIIGYSAPNGSTPVLEIMKGFSDDYHGKTHAKAIMSWYPDGENCDARAIFESVKLLEKNDSLATNKVIFFLSDGGGEDSDNLVKQKIKFEYPNFQFTGPKDYTDAIRYALANGIKTYVFNLEQFQSSTNNYDMMNAFRRYYGENISLIENLSDIMEIFTKCLLEIFKKR